MLLHILLHFCELDTTAQGQIGLTHILLLIVYIYGHSSIDLDECETGNNTCSVDASCDNLLGSYECKCLPGFTGDGHNCTGQTMVIYCLIRDLTLCIPYMHARIYTHIMYTLDNDECSMGEYSCHLNAECMNTWGNYTCECLDGFTDDGREYCQKIGENFYLCMGNIHVFATVV